MSDPLLVKSFREPAAPSQYRIRDLLLVTLALGVLLGLGRAFGGGVGMGEIALLAVAGVSIVVAAVFLRRRWVWGACLAALLPLATIVIPANIFVRLALAAVLTAHFFFAAMPVLAVDPRSARWPWVAAAAGCQLAAALFTPADAPSMAGAAAVLSWGLALVAILWRYKQLRARATDVHFEIKRERG
ncbi:MAG: hypothetical protein KY475_08815 [Planctomycetes bacterium]|nr:hypothetical protein [Planctomycetota bacterium]